MCYELGRMLVLQRRERSALRQWGMGLRLEPRDVRGYLAVAEVVARQGKERQSQGVWEEAWRRCPATRCCERHWRS